MLHGMKDMVGKAKPNLQKWIKKKGQSRDQQPVAKIQEKVSIAAAKPKKQPKRSWSLKG